MAITTEAVRSRVVVDPPETLSTDIAIVGSGMGGERCPSPSKTPGRGSYSSSREISCQQNARTGRLRRYTSTSAIRTRPAGTTRPRGKALCPATITTWAATPSFTGRHCPDSAPMTSSRLSMSTACHLAGRLPMLTWSPTTAKSSRCSGSTATRVKTQPIRGARPAIRFLGYLTKARPHGYPQPPKRWDCTHSQHHRQWTGVTVEHACCATPAIRSPAWWMPKATPTRVLCVQLYCRETCGY